MQTINPLVVSVGPAAGTTPIYPTQLIEHGGGVKKVIAVAAMVLIPVAAPAIASSIAASGVLGAAVSTAMATTAGAVVSSAIVGAGLGAITAKVTGTSVKAGAIGGALGGGFGGYRAASAGTFGTPAGGISGTTDRILGTNFSGTQPTTQTLDGTQYASADGTGTVQNAVLETTGEQVVGTGGELTFAEKMASVPSKIADKITNPDTLANLTLQAGGQLLATTLVPPGSMPELSAEEQQVLEEYKAELADLKQNNEAAFNAKMDASKQFLVQAGYFSPEYFGLQSANKTATDQERKLREYRRTAGLTNFRNSGMSAAEERRAALDSGRNVQSSYDSGFQKGMTAQNQALSTGYGMIPASQGTGYANALVGLNTMYSGMRDQQDKKRENIAEFFGGLGTSTGNSKEDKKKLKDIQNGKAPPGGLNTSGFTDQAIA